MQRAGERDRDLGRFMDRRASVVLRNHAVAKERRGGARRARSCRIRFRLSRTRKTLCTRTAVARDGSSGLSSCFFAEESTWKKN